MLKAFRLRRRLDRLKETNCTGTRPTETSMAILRLDFKLLHHGPLCAEPIEGMSFFVERVEIDSGGMGKEDGKGRELTIGPTIDQ